MTAPPQATPAPASPPMRSNAWIGSVDGLITLAVLVLALFCASFMSRNSDQWLQFAAGRDLLNGKYSLGSDPYSYLSEGRVWVNHSWLHDVSVYLLYSNDPSGRTVVAVKAVLFALSFAVVLLIRPKGVPAWPWWLLAGIGVLAAAPHAMLRSSIGSGLCIALTLYVLLRCDWRRGSWRYPMVLAVLCALWANLDQWFLLGPIMVAITLLGEIIQARLSRLAPRTGPAIPDLAKALGLCLVATLLNPHHVRVWQLPIELGIDLPAEIMNDQQLSYLRMSPLAKAYWDQTAYGKNVNGGAFLALFIIGGGMLALGLARIRLACVLLWVLFAALALTQYRLILFFAIAAVPLAALPLSDLASRFGVEPQSRGIQLAGSITRLIGLPLSLLLLLFAWPGWLHPIPGDRAFQRRVTLGVEPDPGYARAATLLNDARDRTPALAPLHGAPISEEFANHIAWFAPRERVAVNGRLRHHLPELPAWLALRRVVNGDSTDLASPMKQLKADYVSLSSRAASAGLNIARLGDFLRDNPLSLWHLDGRVAILGTQDGPLKYDPVALAFGRDPEPLPEPVIAPPPSKSRESADDYVVHAKPVPLATLDAIVYFDYSGEQWQLAVQEAQQTTLAHQALSGLPDALVSVQPLVSDRVLAANLLTQRAARRAIAENADDPLAYFLLARSLGNNATWMPYSNSNDFEVERITLLRRFLVRSPEPAELSLNDYQPVFKSLELLIGYYQQNKFQDCFLEMNLQLLDSQKRMVPQFGVPADQVKAAMEQIDRRRAALIKAQADLAGNSPPPGTPATQQAGQYYSQRRPLAMLDLLLSGAFKNDSSGEAIAAEIHGIDLCLNAGLLEKVRPLFEPLREKVKTANIEGEPYDALQDKMQRIAGKLSLSREAMETGRAQLPPPLPPGLLNVVRDSIRSPQDFSFRSSGILDGALGGGQALFVGTIIVNGSLGNWIGRSNFELRLGVIHLLEGNHGAARECFERALAPQDIPLPTFTMERAAAERYLKLLKTQKN